MPRSSRGGKRYRSLDDPETLRLFAQNLGEGIYVTDQDGRILDCNPAFLEIFGVGSLTDLATFHASDLLVDPERRNLEMAMLARDGTVREFELEIVRPDGQRRTVLDTTYQVRDPVTGEIFFHGVLIDITRRKELEDQLREQLKRDALTGCYNRRYLIDLEQELERQGEDRWGCMYLDIDHFKRHNDVHGHRSGDLVLQRMARFLMREVRAEEPVIRMGGDEFLIVLYGENAARTEGVALRLQHAAARSAPVPFSLGWAQREGREGLQQTVERADKHMIGVRVLSRSGDWSSLPAEMERRKRSTE
jgi:diguanylate cyclase (GGDEF)-like protein/PAS domain S-box-containing protein